MEDSGQLFLPFSEKNNHHALYSGLSYLELEKLLFEHVQESKNSDPLKPVIIVVPSGITASYLRKKINCGGFQIMNLKRLALHIAGEEMQGKEIPSFGEHVLARETMEKVIEKNSFLFPFIDSPGLLQFFLLLVKEIRQGGVDLSSDIDFLTEKVQKSGELSDQTRFLTVLELLKEYRNTFREKYFDVEDMLLKASLNASRFPEIFRTNCLYIYGFFHFDTAQRKFIDKLSKHLDINSYLPVLQGNLVSESMLKFYENLGFVIYKTEHLTLPDENNLRNVQNALFIEKSKREPLKYDETVRILSCPTQTDEVREVARMVLRFAEEGTPFDEMGILIKNTANYGFLFQETFTSLGIPTYYHDGLPAVNSPEGKTIKLFLNLTGKNLPRFEVMEFLSSGNINFANIFDDKIKPSPAFWDYLTRKAGIRKGYDNWKKQLVKLRNRTHNSLEKSEKDEKEKYNLHLQEIDSLISLIDRLGRDLGSFPQVSSWETYVRQLEKMIRLYVDGREDYIDPIVSSLENLKELDSIRTPVSFDVFRTFAMEKIQTTSVKSGSFKKGCVNIFSLASSPGLTFSCIFLSGLSAKDMPGRRAENPLLYDREMNFINRSLGERVHVMASSEIQEQMPVLFSMAARSCTKKLVLSYSRTEPDSNSEVVPSPYLLEVGKVLAGRNVFYGEMDKIPGFKGLPPRFYRVLEIQEALDAGEYRESVLRKGKLEGNKNFARDLAFLEKPFRRILFGWENKSCRDVFTSHDGRISGDELLAWTKKRCREIFSLASATKLEEYHTCPYRFFLKRIIGIEPVESPEDIKAISPKDRGDLYHRILHEFFMNLKKENRLPLSLDQMDYYSKTLEDIISSTCEEAVSSGITGDYSSWYEQTIDLKNDLQHFLKIESSLADNPKKAHRANFTPALFEHSFGFTDETGICTVPPAEIKLDADDVFNYLGKIDRIDLSPDNSKCLIIDYKTGRHDSKKNRSNCLIGGKQLQLPLYLYSALQILSGINDLSDCGAILYFITRRGDFREVEFSGEELRNKHQEVVKLIKGVLAGVNNGCFIPYPRHILPVTEEGEKTQETGHCTICDYKDICSEDIESLYLRKESDPFIEEFKELKKIL
jgi:ATP-dependent helicase/nuclease subunit B